MSICWTSNEGDIGQAFLAPFYTFTDRQLHKVRNKSVREGQDSHMSRPNHFCVAYSCDIFPVSKSWISGGKTNRNPRVPQDLYEKMPISNEHVLIPTFGSAVGWCGWTQPQLGAKLSLDAVRWHNTKNKTGRCVHWESIDWPKKIQIPLADTMQCSSAQFHDEVRSQSDDTLPRIVLRGEYILSIQIVSLAYLTPCQCIMKGVDQNQNQSKDLFSTLDWFRKDTSFEGLQVMRAITKEVDKYRSAIASKQWV